MYENKIKQRLNEVLSKEDRKEVEKLIDTSLDDFIKDKKFEKKIEQMVIDNLKIKGNKKLEKDVVEISKNVLVQLYRAFWVRRNFWKNSIKD